MDVTALTDEAIAAIVDPVARAQALRAITKTKGTLTTPQSRIYRQAIAELHGNNERKQIWIARTVGVSCSAISKLLRKARLAASEVSA